jgi:hypothetical protein
MIASDFQRLLPQRKAKEADTRPVYYLWIFDPDTDQVHMDSNKGKAPAHHILHDDLAIVRHPEAVRGYAYSIEGGWRITDDDHKEVKDHHIVRRVVQKLRTLHPEPALPHLNAPTP